MSLRILHFTVVRALTPGQRNQLLSEVSAAKELVEVKWTTLAYHTKVSTDFFVRQLPWVFRPMFLRNLFAWIWLIRHAHKYDYVICRHMSFDPVALFFAWWIPNRVTVHHAKEEKELRLIRCGWKGWAASMLERWSGGVAIRNAVALLGVTEEIKDYELDLHTVNGDLNGSVYPNSVRVEEFELIEDKRPHDRIELAFMCGTFSSWHGLDILLDQFEDLACLAALDKPITLHLMGRLNGEQEEQVLRLQKRQFFHCIEWHGLICPETYRPLLARCHVGLSSLAIGRKGLRQAATLKVREMLALGLPVYSGHQDTALPEDFPWYFHGNGSLIEIIGFAQNVSSVTRQEVRESSRQWIEKMFWMKAVAEFLQNTNRPRS